MELEGGLRVRSPTLPYGITLASRQQGLTLCKSCAFISSATTVACPMGVRPINFFQSWLQRKCSSHETRTWGTATATSAVARMQRSGIREKI